MLLRKETLLKQKVRNETNLRISCFIVFKCNILIGAGYQKLRIFTVSYTSYRVENEMIMIYNGTEFLL